MLWFEEGPAANSTAPFAGYLDGEMDSKGIRFSPLVGTECLRVSGLVLGALRRAREGDCSTLLTPSTSCSTLLRLFYLLFYLIDSFCSPLLTSLSLSSPCY